MINAVFWSFAFGLVMVSSFVLAMPDTAKAALQGANVFFNLFANLAVPTPLKDFLYIAIVLSNYLCALAGVTSTSRMIFAFSRDGGLPGHKIWRHVNPIHRTPVAAIWLAAFLAFLSTLYSSAFSALAAGCAMFLYVSYAMPIAAGIFAEGKHWSEYGPFRLGIFSKPLAILSVLGTLVVIFVGIQPPNNILINYGLGLIVLMLVLWFGVARRHFPGPPIGAAAVAARSAEIAAEEQAVGQT
jgi:amino acid transporter